MRYYNIPVFVPHYGCPFDCVFCNQKHITGFREEQSGEKTKEIIKEHLKTIPKVDRRVEVAFFGGSFTAIDKSLQEELLKAAYEFIKSGEIDGIRLSTRPDFISDEVLEFLLEYGVTAIELGVQSMRDDVLLKSGRGHTKADVIKASEIIKKYPVKLGLQMMTGLPGDTYEKSIETAKEIIKLKPHMVRIYPTLVIKDTCLSQMYLSGEYTPQDLESAIYLSKELIKMFRKNNIEVIRVGLQATDEMTPGTNVLAGPYHSAFGEMAENAIFYDKIIDTLNGDKTAEIKVNPKDISKAIGNKKRNYIKLKENGIDIKFIQDETVPLGEIIRKD